MVHMMFVYARERQDKSKSQMQARAGLCAVCDSMTVGPFNPADSLFLTSSLFLADSLFLTDSTINSAICKDSLICERVLFLH